MLQKVDRSRGQDHEEDYGSEAHGQLAFLGFYYVYYGLKRFRVPMELEQP